MRKSVKTNLTRLAMAAGVIAAPALVAPTANAATVDQWDQVAA